LIFGGDRDLRYDQPPLNLPDRSNQFREAGASHGRLPSSIWKNIMAEMGAENRNLGTGCRKKMVLPEFAWMNVDEHRLSALTLPGQGELWNKEPEFALR